MPNPIGGPAPSNMGMMQQAGPSPGNMGMQQQINSGSWPGMLAGQRPGGMGVAGSLQPGNMGGAMMGQPPYGPNPGGPGPAGPSPSNMGMQGRMYGSAPQMGGMGYGSMGGQQMPYFLRMLMGMH